MSGSGIPEDKISLVLKARKELKMFLQRKNISHASAAGKMEREVPQIRQEAE